MKKTIDPEKFVRAWQSAKSVKEVAEKFGISYNHAVTKSRYLQLRGVPLKKLTSQLDIAKLIEIAKEAL